MGSGQHLEFFNASLQVYEKSLENVIEFVSDNCSLNQHISSLAENPLIGCAAQTFNLIVEEWCE